MRSYAQGTEVGVSRSMDEIRRTVLRFGAGEFATFEAANRMAIAFTYKRLSVRMEIEIPDRNDKKFQFTPSRRWKRSESQAYEAWEGECRRRVRALAAIIKAKLVGIQEGVLSFEDEFLPYVLTAGNKTIGEQLRPQLEAAMAGKALPKRLLLPESERPDDKTVVIDAATSS